MNIVAINKLGYTHNQEKLSDVCSFPILQDTEEVDAWSLLGGGKDDFFLYNSDGTLAVYLRSGGKVSTKLSTPEGYANIRDTLMAME